MEQIFCEDVEIGREYSSTDRLTTQTDLEEFAYISGDRHPLHTNAEFAATARFGQQILHGPFGVAITMGPFAQFGEFSETCLALTNIDHSVFRHPVFIDDRIHLLTRIASTSLTKSRAAVVNRNMKLINENSKTVQEGSMGLLIAQRESPVSERHSRRPVGD